MAVPDDDGRSWFWLGLQRVGRVFAPTSRPSAPTLVATTDDYGHLTSRIPSPTLWWSASIAAVVGKNPYVRITPPTGRVARLVWQEFANPAAGTADLLGNVVVSAVLSSFTIPSKDPTGSVITFFGDTSFAPATFEVGAALNADLTTGTTFDLVAKHTAGGGNIDPAIPDAIYPGYMLEFPVGFDVLFHALNAWTNGAAYSQGQVYFVTPEGSV